MAIPNKKVDMLLNNTRKGKIVMADIVLIMLKYVTENESNASKVRQMGGIAFAKRTRYSIRQAGGSKIVVPKYKNANNKWRNKEIFAEGAEMCRLQVSTFYYRTRKMKGCD